MFVSYLRTFTRHGPEGDPDARRYRPDRRRPQPRIHHPGRHRRERGVLRPRPISTCRCPAPTPTSATMRRLAASSSDWTRPTPPPTTCTTRPPCDAMSRGRAAVGARHRGRPHLLFRRQIFRADEGHRDRPGRQGARRARWAPTASARSRLVAAIIEASHDEAGIIWPESVAPFDVGADQHEGAATRRATALPTSSTRRSSPPGSTCFTTTPTSGRARSSPHADLIGVPLAGHRRPARRRQAGEVEIKRPRDRRARDRAAGAA